MLTTSRINLVVIISEQTFSKCVFVFCNRNSSEKLYNKLPTKASYTHAEIEHEVKEWIELAAESEEGLHQEDRRICTAVDSQTVLDN